MRTAVAVNPLMLSWAIARAGMDMQSLTGTFPKLPDWLANTAQPTVRQLENFSKKVHLPFGYLFLNEPPQEAIPFPFFRTGKAQPDNKVSPVSAEATKHLGVGLGRWPCSVSRLCRTILGSFATHQTQVISALSVYLHSTSQS